MPTVTLSNDKRFAADAATSLLDAAGAAGLVLDHSCRTGRCGSCKAPVRSGRTIPLIPEPALSAAERDAGIVLTCARSAADDVSLDIEDLPADLAPAKTWPSRIDRLERLAPDVMKVVLRLPPTAAFRHRAGQSIDVIGPGGVRRSYSIANAVDAASGVAAKLDLQIRQVEGGAFSRHWFHEAKAGDLLRFEGPRGTFFLRDDLAGTDLVLLATGTGIAPMQAMLDELKARAADAQPRSVTLLWGGRVPADLYWQPAHAGLRFVPVLSRADATWAGARGHVQQVLLQAGPRDWARTAVYACGSAAMVDGARAALRAAGLAPRRFLSDAFIPSAAQLPLPAGERVGVRGGDAADERATRALTPALSQGERESTTLTVEATP